MKKISDGLWKDVDSDRVVIKKYGFRIIPPLGKNPGSGSA